MAKVQIDFASQGYRFWPNLSTSWRIAYLCLLLVVSTAGGLIAYRLQVMQAQNQMLEQELQGQAQQYFIRGGGQEISRLPPDGHAHAEQLAISHLNLPWSRLFQLLARTQTPDIALLLVDCAPADASVKLHAEARNTASMLDYVSRLRTADGVAWVQLSTQQVNEQEEAAPIRFELKLQLKGFKLKGAA